MLKKAILPLTICYTIFIAVVSLIRLNNLPKVKISFGDKIFHFIVYGILTLFWFYTFFLSLKKPYKKSILYAVTFSVIFGIILEVLQDKLTAYRAFDVYDAVSNTLGALLAASAIWFTKSLHVKN